MARTGGCAVCWRRVSNPMSWRCAATSRCGSAAARSKRTSGLLADALPPDAWACHAAGEGAKGPRLYDWARPRPFWPQDPQWEHWLLVRRSRKNAEERADYVVFAPAGATLAELAGVAGLRWTIETCFATAKDELGLDHCEARSWPAWHRHITLVMAAAAFVEAARRSGSRLDDRSARKQTERKESGAGRRRFANCSPQLGVTVPAIRHLLARAIFLKPTTRELLFRWADWRLRHNAAARDTHYRRRIRAQLYTRAEFSLTLRSACIRNEQNSSRIPSEEILRAVCRARSTAPRPFCKQRYAAVLRSTVE